MSDGTQMTVISESMFNLTFVANQTPYDGYVKLEHGGFLFVLSQTVPIPIRTWGIGDLSEFEQHNQVVYTTAFVSNVPENAVWLCTKKVSSKENGKKVWDSVNYVASLRATVLTTYFEFKNGLLNMYRPITSTTAASYSGTSLWKSTSKSLIRIKGFSVGLTGLGIFYDYRIGVPRYNAGVRDGWEVSPQDAKINTIVSLYSLLINPTIGIVYFGFGALYPEKDGFKAASEAATEAEEKMMEYSWYNYFNKM